MAERTIRIKLDAAGAITNADKIQEKLSDLGVKADFANAKLSESAKGVGKALGGMGRSAGQASIQVQQLVGQVQGGVNPMIALSQQAADLGFVLGVPLLGAVVSIAAALGASLAPAIFNSEKASSKLETAMESLAEIIKISDAGIVEYTDKIKTLAKTSNIAAKLEIEAALIKAKRASEEAAKGISEAISEIEGVGVGFSDLNDFIEAYNKNLGFSLTSTRGFTEITTELGEKFGLAGENARKLGRSLFVDLAEIVKSPTAEGFKQLQDRLAGVAVNSENVDDDVKVLISGLNEYFLSAQKAADATRLLEENLRQLGQLNSGEDGSKIFKDTTTGAPAGFTPIEAQVEFFDAQRALQQSDLEFWQMYQQGKVNIATVAADEIAALEKRQTQIANIENNARMQIAAIGMGVLQGLFKQGSAAQKVFFLTQKGIQAASAWNSAQTAAMLAMETLPPPLGETVAAKRLASGKIAVASILASTISGFPSGGASAGSVGGGARGASQTAAPPLPRTPQGPEQVQTLAVDTLVQELRNLGSEPIPASFAARLLEAIPEARQITGGG